MFCGNCGTQVKVYDKFCSKCGFKLKDDINIEQDVLIELEKDFSSLDNKLEEVMKPINSPKEYLRKKWVTILLFLIPYASFFGIHHFYNKRYLRGILYITLDLIMFLFINDTILSHSFLVSIVIVITVFYFFITDLNWIIDLPPKYCIKNNRLKSKWICEEYLISNQATSSVINTDPNTEIDDVVIYNNKKRIEQIPTEILEVLWIKDKSNLDINNSLEFEPSLIDLSLEILETCNIEDNQDIGYYPCYSELTPEQRFIYLSWLKDITKPINIGYVFIFYYGLERHLLFGDFEKAFNIIKVLREHHFNSSFLAYSEDAILISIMKKNKLEYIKKVSFSNSNPLLLALVISSAFKRFNAEDLILFSRYVGFHNNRYIKGERKKFINQLNILLKEKYNEEYYNIKDEYIKRYTETFTLAFANFSLDEIYRFEEFPNILSNEDIRGDIFNLLEETHERVKIIKREERKVKKA